MRGTGKLIIALSVAIAVFGGVFLAAAVAGVDGDLSAVAPVAALLFLVVTASAAIGIYFYYRGEPVDEDAGRRSESELARRLSEALGKSDRVTFAALADALDTDAEAVARLLAELARFGVLPAAVSWQGTTIYPKNRGYLASLAGCLHCGEPLPERLPPAACAACGTVHYDI